MVDWPQPLVADLARRRCVLVIGSGVSRQSTGDNNAKPPLWKDFLKASNENCPDGEKQHITDAINSGDLLHACEWLKKYHGEQWSQYLRAQFKTPRYKPSELHKLLTRLDTRIVFTLNFDDIYERTALDIYDGDCTVKKYYDTDIEEFLRGTGRYIIKVHGSLDTPNKLIFTQKEYSEARVEAAKFYNAFDAALLSHTFFFVGTGCSDPDINLILENQNFYFSESHPHYFLSSNGLNADLKESLLNNRNLKILEYDPVDGNYIGLVDSIKDLLEKVEEERSILSQNQSW